MMLSLEALTTVCACVFCVCVCMCEWVGAWMRVCEGECLEAICHFLRTRHTQETTDLSTTTHKMKRYSRNQVAATSVRPVFNLY